MVQSLEPVPYRRRMNICVLLAL